MTSNRSDVLHTEWKNLIKNLNATGDDQGDPCFQKAVSRLESLWKERVINQNNEASGVLLSALAQALTIYTTTASVTKAFCPTTTGDTPRLPKPIRFPRRGPL